MRGRRLVLLLLTGLLALAPWVLPRGAAAQDDGDVPLPLDSLAPVLAVIGPASSTVCGGVGVVGLLAPAALGPAAPTVLTAVGPVFTLCGAIPSTPGSDRYSCPLDQQALTLVGKVTGLAGVPPSFDLRPVGQVLETLGAALDLLLRPTMVDELLDGPSILLQCTHGTAEEAAPTVPTTVAPAPPATDDTVPTSTAALPDVPLPDELPTLPSVPVATPAAPAPTPPTVTTGFETPLGRVPFSYAAVFALPFVALLAGAAVGKDLLSPLAVEADDPDDPAPGGPP